MGARERGDGWGKRCSWGFGGQRKEDRSHGGVARAYAVPERPGDYQRVVSMSHLLPTLRLRLTNGRVGGTHGTVESPTSVGMELPNQRRMP